MTWGEHMIGLGIVAGIATTVGLTVWADRKKALDYGAAGGVVVAGFIVFALVASLSQLDSAYVASCEASAAALKLARSTEATAYEAYIDHLKSTELYDFYQFVKTGRVPEQFTKRA